MTGDLNKAQKQANELWGKIVTGTDRDLLVLAENLTQEDVRHYGTDTNSSNCSVERDTSVMLDVALSKRAVKAQDTDANDKGMHGDNQVMVIAWNGSARITAAHAFYVVSNPGDASSKTLEGKAFHADVLPYAKEVVVFYAMD